jgi:NAD(P)H dehydrogenase (quinone)
MKIHSILVHPNQQSLNARLFSLANKHFINSGHSVTELDLFAHVHEINEFAQMMYQTKTPLTDRKYSSPYYANFNTSMEEKAAKGIYSEFVLSEIQKLKDADLLYIQTPIWFWAVPAMLKFYIENVFLSYEFFNIQNPWSETEFEIEPLMTGKKVMVSFVLGSSQALSQQVIGGKEGITHSIKTMCEFVGYEWMEPYFTWSTRKSLDKCDEYFEDFQQFLTEQFPAR